MPGNPYPNMYTSTGGKPMDITSDADKKAMAQERARGESSRSWQGPSSSWTSSQSDNAMTGRGLY